MEFNKCFANLTSTITWVFSFIHKIKLLFYELLFYLGAIVRVTMNLLL